MAQIPLHPVVAELAATLVPAGNDFVLPDAAIAAARTRVRATPGDQREEVARGLIAWSLKLQRLAGDRTLRARGRRTGLASENRSVHRICG